MTRVAGGQIITSTPRVRPAATAAHRAPISASEARVPFIFQLPASRGLRGAMAALSNLEH